MPFAETLTALGTALGGAASIGGAIQGFRSYKKAKKYADYTDKLNDENYRMQLADTERLIQEDRLYNDFSSVAARARAAGINPLAVIGNGNAGGQSISASAPAASSPLSSNGDFGASTISQSAAGILGATEQFALLDARKREAEAEANLKEIEAAWADRKYDVDYREKESNIALRNAQIGTEKQRERLVTLQGNMQEIINSQQGPLGDMKLRKLSEEIRLFGLEAEGLEIKNSKQAEILDAQLAESRARVYETYESVRQKYIELEQNAEKINLSKAELDEVKRANKELEQFRDDELKFKETSDKKNRTQRYILGSVNAACRVADTVAGFINPLKNIASSRPALADSWADSAYIFAD